MNCRKLYFASPRQDQAYGPGSGLCQPMVTFTVTRTLSPSQDSTFGTTVLVTSSNLKFKRLGVFKLVSVSSGLHTKLNGLPTVGPGARTD